MNRTRGWHRLVVAVVALVCSISLVAGCKDAGASSSTSSSTPASTSDVLPALPTATETTPDSGSDLAAPEEHDTTPDTTDAPAVVPDTTTPDAATGGGAPDGATAECNDGHYSFSKHHSGTCSDHGGVLQWLDGTQ